MGLITETNAQYYAGQQILGNKTSAAGANLVLTGLEISPISMWYKALSNSASIVPEENLPKSPPFSLESHSEYSFARSSNRLPEFKRLIISNASSLSSNKICLAL